MLDLQFSINGAAGSADDIAWAVQLYRRQLVAAAARRLVGRLLGRAGALRELPRAQGGHELGLRAVPIAEIVGSEGRSADFDRAFAPTQEHSRSRWLSVAAARRGGRGLPPVRLIRAADGYYVRDGHHRISVARAFGEEFIEAEVIDQRSAAGTGVKM